MPQNLLNVPHIQQQQRSDCLAACAAMLFAHIHVAIPYTRLLRVLNVQQHGTPGRNLIRLSQFDVEVLYREGSMDILQEIIQGGRPCITLVQTGSLRYWSYSTEHAVVVVGIDSDSVYLNDPAFVQHPIRATRVEFELAWMDFNYRYGMITTGSTPRA